MAVGFFSPQSLYNTRRFFLLSCLHPPLPPLPPPLGGAVTWPDGLLLCLLWGKPSGPHLRWVSEHASARSRMPTSLCLLEVKGFHPYFLWHSRCFQW